MRVIRATAAGLLFIVAAAGAQEPFGTTDPFESRFKTKANFQIRFKAPEKGGEVRLYTRDPVHYEKDVSWEGAGEVVIDYQDVHITADKGHYDFPSKTATLEGHVVIDQGPTRLAGSRASFQLESKTGTLEDATADLAPTYHIIAESIEKIGEATYRVHHGVFTACDVPKPDWSFYLSEATVTLDARAAGTEGEVTGFVVLTRGADRRRIPFWGRVTRPLLGAERSTPLTRPGLHAGNNRNHPAKVSRYRYPETPTGGGISATLAGPEQVFSVRLTKAAANFGVAITSHAHGVRVEPRIVAGGDENRLEGETAIPLNYNPYLRTYGDYAPAAGVIQPRAGAYDVVFDSPTAAGAGPFTFRFWVNDRTPPSVTIASRAVHRGRRLVVRLADAGSGVDPTSLRVWLDGTETEPPRVAAGRALVPTTGLEPGRHALRVQVSDYQETRNMENTGAILPNTRVARTTFVVR